MLDTPARILVTGVICNVDKCSNAFTVSISLGVLPGIQNVVTLKGMLGSKRGKKASILRLPVKGSVLSFTGQIKQIWTSVIMIDVDDITNVVVSEPPVPVEAT